MYFDGPHLELNSIQLASAIYVWHRRERIELLKSLLQAAAALGTDQVKKYAEDLINEAMPLLKQKREKQLNNMQSALSKEVGQVMSVTPLDGRKPSKRGRLQRRRR